MNTGDTCRVWAEENYGYPDACRPCKAILTRWDLTDAAFEGEGKKPRREYDDWGEVERIEIETVNAAKAHVVDGSGYHAELRTMPDFGCVLHSPRDGD
jgi:hypothetical protein